MTGSRAPATRVLYQMVRADFLERVRRYSFLVTLAASLILGYSVAAKKIWIVVGNEYRGVYNSAWIGALMSVTCSTFLSLAGFYIVKNAVQRDTESRVGQILAATPMRKDFYALAKTLSNFAVLACMVGVLMLASIAMQVLQPDPYPVSLWKLWAPFVFLALPSMMITASLAFLFETIPGLRGGIGNVAYFFLWTALISLGATGLNDPSGLQLLSRSTQQTLRLIDPTTSNNFHFSLTIGGERAVHTFLWKGFDWSANILLGRLLWIGVAAGLALIGSLFFHRFDPARSWLRRPAKTAPEGLIPAAAEQQQSAGFVNLSASHLTPIVRRAARWRFFQLVISELRLMLKGQRWWWYAGAAGLIIGSLVSRQADTREGFLIVAWVWPIFLWSQMGCREARCDTSDLLFSCERSLSRQLPALWSAGVILALVTGAGAGVRMLLIGDSPGFETWLAAAVFIPSLALALGTWTGGSKAFEAVYIAWWYAGPLHHTRDLDFMGTTAESSTALPYAIAAFILFAAAVWRRRQSLGYA